MKLGYLDGFAGISGDMMLGALLDAGVPLQVLESAVATLGLGATLSVERTDRSGISCTQVRVLEQGRPADGGLPEEPERVPAGLHRHGNGPLHSHGEQNLPENTTAHAEGRSLSAIRTLLSQAAFPDEVRQLALRTFDLLGAAEARIHNVDVDEIHFHEVGAVDAIVDIVAASAGLVHLACDTWYCAPLNVGSGMVRCAHGVFPVPAPATADLLRGVPTYAAHVQKELVTPTGAALVRALGPVFGAQPPMTVDVIGYGAGSRNPPGFPNVLRLSIGKSSADVREAVVVLETAVDDCSPQVLAYVMEQALAAGALDVMQTPVVMKKGRAGVLLTILCSQEKQAALEELLLRETTTLGVRSRREQRRCLARSHVTVSTRYGIIRMKTGSEGDQEWNATPEFEDCRQAAEQHKVALKLVQQAAIAEYSKGRPA